MSPSIAQLMRALPEESEALAEAALREPMAFRPVPVGRWRRLRLLATLQARIAAAYLFYWIRGWFQRAEQKEQSLAEMVRNGRISRDTAIAHCFRPEDLARYLS